MASNWPVGRFGDVMQPVSRPVQVEASSTYRTLGVQWYAKGLFVREEKSGHEIRAKELYRVEASDFVYNRLFAWKGSFGIVGPDTAGGVVSSEFPCFKVDMLAADPRFLRYYLSQEWVWKEIERASTGQTSISRLRFKEHDFLAMELPVPPIVEQQRIVARIEALARRVEEAQGLRQQTELSTRGMLLAAYNEIIGGCQHKIMAEVAPLVRRPIKIDNDKQYPELGIRSFGKGSFQKPAIGGVELGTKRLFSIEPGDLIFNNVFAWEGAVAVARPQDAGRFGSHRFITCLPKARVATAKFLCFYFLTAEGLERLGSASPGGAGRNRTLGLGALAQIQVPVPDYSKQLWFDELQKQAEKLRGARAETQKAFDALMPSILAKAFAGEL